jgi:hypothetical protein
MRPVTEAQQSPGPAPGEKPRARRPFEGWGSAAARGLRAAGRAVAHVSVLLFGHVKLHSGKAYADFQRRARHARYRAYALGSYALIAAATLGAQLYEPNSIGAYVRVEKVDFPAATAVFVRNDSDKPWRAVRVLLNGKYSYEPLRIEPHEYKVVRVDRFLAVEHHGSKTARAPRETEVRHLLIECDRGRYETELR